MEDREELVNYGIYGSVQLGGASFSDSRGVYTVIQILYTTNRGVHTYNRYTTVYVI